MDRTPNSSDSAAAKALLQKLKTDLEQNAQEKQTVAAEAASLTPPITGKRYTFRVMKQSEYLSKKKIADKIAAAADDADISDDELEVLLRSYFSSKDTVSEKTEEEAENPSAADIPQPHKDLGMDVSDNPDHDGQSMPVLHDPDKRLIEEEEAFCEEVPLDTLELMDTEAPVTDPPIQTERTFGTDAAASEPEGEISDLAAFDNTDFPNLEDLLDALPDDILDTLPASTETPDNTPLQTSDTEQAEETALPEDNNDTDDLSDAALDALLNGDMLDDAALAAGPADAAFTNTDAPDDEEDLAAFLASIAGDVQIAEPIQTEMNGTQTGPQSEQTDAAPDAAETESDSPQNTKAAPTDENQEFDQTDLDLMIAFGMDEQLEKTVGKEKAQKYKKAIGARKDDHFHEMHMGDRPDTVQDKHAEYVSNAQNKEIFGEYKKHYSSLLFRFLGAFVLLVLLFLFENNNLIGLHLPSFFDREQYPLVYTLFDFQLVVLCGAMIPHALRTGIRAIFHGRPVPESIAGFLFLGSAVYTAGILALCPLHGLQLYNFPLALTAIFALCYEFMNLRREIMSFKVVSSKKLKYAIDSVPAQESEAERHMFSEYLADDPSIFRIKRAAFIEGFFQRTETYPRTQRILRTILPTVLLLTLAFFAADFMLTGSIYTALNVAYITLLLTLPSCAFVAFSYPMYRASSFAYEKDSAMIGEASLGEYADASVVSFDDKEVFPAQSVRVRNVKVYGNNRIDHVIYAAASVFHVVGGPLADVFETATGELGYAENVSLIRLSKNGMEARVDGGAVLIGKAAFLSRYGYSVTVSESEKTMEETGDASVLYIAYDNMITAKLYIQYAVDPEFEAVLKQLYRQGVCVGIKTSDPNIDDRLLSCKIRMAKYPVKIIKCAEPKETAIVMDRLSSGIVSKSSAKSLLQTLAMCDRVLSTSRINNVISIVAILLGMAAMAFFVVSGMALTMAPLWIALYQLFWIIPIIIIARNTV